MVPRYDEDPAATLVKLSKDIHHHRSVIIGRRGRIEEISPDQKPDNTVLSSQSRTSSGQNKSFNAAPCFERFRSMLPGENRLIA